MFKNLTFAVFNVRNIYCLQYAQDSLSWTNTLFFLFFLWSIVRYDHIKKIIIINSCNQFVLCCLPNLVYYC